MRSDTDVDDPFGCPLSPDEVHTVRSVLPSRVTWSIDVDTHTMRRHL